MNIRLSYAIRFLTLSLILLCSDYSYSTLRSPTLAEHSSNIQLIKKEYQEMMSHYDQIIKQAKDSQDSEKYKKLRWEAAWLEDNYENFMAVNELYCTLYAKYARDLEYYYFRRTHKKDELVEELNDFERHIYEIDKLQGAELVSYMRRSALLRILKDSRPEFFNEDSLTMINEYDSLKFEYFDTIDRSSSQDVVKYDRFTYLNEVEMPKLILSLRDSMKDEIPVIREEIERLDNWTGEVGQEIYPYFEVLKIYGKVSSNYYKKKNKYILLRKSSNLRIKSSCILKKTVEQ